MRLPIFELIEETTTILARRETFYAECARDLETLFFKLFQSTEAFLGTNSRVKSSASLREKILRKRLYLQWTSAYDILNGLSDLIGLRIECRFLSEEQDLYRMLKSSFSEQNEEGLFFVYGHPEVMLNLSVEQPEKQKNGLEIYRIDGKYNKGGLCIPFEIQIKALVDVFWTEIEHQLVYKNNRYRFMDKFYKEMLFSAYATLQQVDHQLRLLFEQNRDQEHSRGNLSEFSLQKLIASVLSEVFRKKMDQSLGFTLNFTYASDILSRYLLAHCKPGSMDAVFFQLYERINRATEEEMDFEKAIELENFEATDIFCKKIGRFLMEQINVDYDWNLFLRMLFVLENGDNVHDFSDFLRLLRKQYAGRSLYQALNGRWSRAEIHEFKERLLSILADLLVEYGNVHMLAQYNIESVQQEIRMICEEAAHVNIERVDWQTVEAVLRSTVYQMS